MSFIVEQAASTGYENIMDVIPSTIHQRIGVMMGSKNEIAQVVGCNHV